MLAYIPTFSSHMSLLWIRYHGLAKIPIYEVTKIHICTLIRGMDIYQIPKIA